MENSPQKVVIHPRFFETLFADKRFVSGVFNDVLGLYQINHIAITRIDSSQQLLTFSSKPALEFNLFNSKLWWFDKTYDPQWFRLCTHANWQSLYQAKHYDELYHTKQIRHHLSNTLSLVSCQKDSYYIYSIASIDTSELTKNLFINNPHDFYQIGHYCVNTLEHLFITK